MLQYIYSNIKLLVVTIYLIYEIHKRFPNPSTT